MLHNVCRRVTDRDLGSAGSTIIVVPVSYFGKKKMPKTKTQEQFPMTKDLTAVIYHHFRRDYENAGVFYSSKELRENVEGMFEKKKKKEFNYPLTNSNRKIKNKNLLHRTLLQNNPQPKAEMQQTSFSQSYHIYSTFCSSKWAFIPNAGRSV